MIHLATITGAMIVPNVIMEDTIIHTDEHPYCNDPTCPCQEEQAQMLDEARYEGNFSYLEGTDAAWHC